MTARRMPLAVLTLAASVALAGCAGSTTGPKEPATAAQASASPSPAGSRPAGPAAAVSELRGGHGPFIGSASPPGLQPFDYVQQEYAVSGTASAYQAEGTLSSDGRWKLTPGTSAAYRTRVLVRRPAKASAFSGTVVVEWLNVSGGVDADPDWVTLHEEIVRSGDVWVGVSAQHIGVEGGPVAVKVNVPGSDQAGKGLKGIDPARYGTLVHPGDAYAMDIFTQVARALRSGGALGGLQPQRLIAAGESQSAFALVAYYDGVQPLSRAFDGFFVHSRGATALPIASSAKNVDIASALSGKPTTFRTDQSAPIMDVQTETDVGSVLNSYAARQPDTDRFRLWEVAGTAHADAHLIGAIATSLGCGLPINDGPMHIVAKAAYHELKTWLVTGKPPVIAPRIDVKAGSSPQIQRNAEAIAEGGIRTPPVDVPVATLSGAPSANPSTICLLVGSTKPFTKAQLAQLYPTRADYQKKFDAAADAAISAGFVLPQDRAALLEFARPQMIAG